MSTRPWGPTCARSRASVTGVDTAFYKQCRRVRLAVDALQQRAGSEQEEQDSAVESLVARGQDMDMSPEKEESVGSASLDRAFSSEAARHHQLILKCVRPWITPWRSSSEHGSLYGSPFKPGARPGVQPDQTAWLGACMASLVALGFLFLKILTI